MGLPSLILPLANHNALKNPPNSTISFSISSSVVKDDLLLLICQSMNETVLAPSGWTELGSQATQGITSGVGSTRLIVFYRFATGSEAGQSVTVSLSGLSMLLGQVVVVRGVEKKQFSSSDNFSNGSGTSTGSAPITLTFPCTKISKRQNSRVLIMSSINRQLSFTDNFTDLASNSNLESIEELIDRSVNISNTGGGLACWTGIKTTPGVIGTTTATFSGLTTQVFGYMVLILRSHRNIITFT